MCEAPIERPNKKGVHMAISDLQVDALSEASIELCF